MTNVTCGVEIMLPHAHGEPLLRAQIRTVPEDFQVTEILGFEEKLTGEGQHQWLQIEKRNLNTDQVAGLIARHVGVKRRNVSFAGLKDRNAVTRQWFSVDMARREEPDWSALEDDRLKILQITRHAKKLRRGALKGNRFLLRLRDVQTASNENLDQAAKESVAQRLEQIAQRGVPNYFGEQRFGRDGENVERAVAMFRGEYEPRNRNERGILLSAARSEIFNQICAARVEQNTWDATLPGDWFALAGSRSGFLVEEIDAEIERRIAEFDIHPTGALWGKGDLHSGGTVKALEMQIAENHAELRQGLENAGLEQDRRPLRLVPESLEWNWTEADQLELSFSLPAGSYATMVLRELMI